MAKPKTAKTMKRSKIIVEIASGNKKITNALFELKLLLSDLGDQEVTTWIDSELSGYGASDNIPEYRKFEGTLCGNVEQAVANKILQHKMAIPIKDEYPDFNQRYLRENITAIEEYGTNPSSKEISIPIDLVDANHVTALMIGNSVQIMGAWLKIPPSTYTAILNAVKSRVLDILLMLEKKYGNLDDYTIDFGKDEERAEISQIVVNIIHNDNSISMGDNNKINKSKVGGNDGS